MLDCFFAAPSQPLGEMEEIVIDFGDASTQIFHVGEGSVAVPGLVAGLEEAHRRFGSIPWPELAAARDRARPRRASTPPRSRGSSTRSCSGILERDEGGRRIYGTSGRIETSEFVETLELVRDTGSAALAELLPELAGDLARYEVARPRASAHDDRRSHRPHHARAFARRGDRRCSPRTARGRRDARRQSGRAPSRRTRRRRR